MKNKGIAEDVYIYIRQNLRWKHDFIIIVSTCSRRVQDGVQTVHRLHGRFEHYGI